MATLRLTIGGLTGTRTIEDAKATAVVTLIFDRVVLPSLKPGQPVPTTPAEKLQAVVDWMAFAMRDAARQARRGELAVEHEAATTTELVSIDV